MDDEVDLQIGQRVVKRVDDELKRDIKHVQVQVQMHVEQIVHDQELKKDHVTSKHVQVGHIHVVLHRVRVQKVGRRASIV